MLMDNSFVEVCHLLLAAFVVAKFHHASTRGQWNLIVGAPPIRVTPANYPTREFYRE